MYVKHNKVLKTNTKQVKTKKGKSNRSEFTQKYQVMPKTFIPNARYDYTRRYVAGAAVATSITIANLFSSLVFAATTTVGYSPFYAIRLKRIQIWAPVTTIGTPVTISLTPVAVESTTNSYADLPEMQSDTSDVVDIPAYIDYRPHELHPSGSWHLSNSTSLALVSINVPIGSVVDIRFEANINVITGTQGYTATLVGATVGNIYTLKIASNLNPQSVVSQ